MTPPISSRHVSILVLVIATVLLPNCLVSPAQAASPLKKLLHRLLDDYEDYFDYFSYSDSGEDRSSSFEPRRTQLQRDRQPSTQFRQQPSSRSQFPSSPAPQFSQPQPQFQQSQPQFQQSQPQFQQFGPGSGPIDLGGPDATLPSFTAFPQQRSSQSPPFDIDPRFSPQPSLNPPTPGQSTLQNFGDRSLSIAPSPSISDLLSSFPTTNGPQNGGPSSDGSMFGSMMGSSSTMGPFSSTFGLSSQGPGSFDSSGAGSETVTQISMDSSTAPAMTSETMTSETMTSSLPASSPL